MPTEVEVTIRLLKFLAGDRRLVKISMMPELFVQVSGLPFGVLEFGQSE